MRERAYRTWNRFYQGVQRYDLRTNQRKAYELLKGADEKNSGRNPQRSKNSPTASTASPSQPNVAYVPVIPNTKLQVRSSWFDNDNPFTKTRRLFMYIKKSTAIEDKVTELLADDALMVNI